MPIFRAGSQMFYFAHVPKCAGSSMVHYLQDRFGALAFHDDSFHFAEEPMRWSKTSPQHINIDALNRLFPDGFFDASFAVVRHPVARLISSYHFQFEVERRISADTSFGAWIENVAEQRAKEPYVFDNHTRPMDDIVPPDAKIFQLEQGFDDFVSWLDQVTGNTDGPRALEIKNKRGAHRQQTTAKIVPTPEEIELVANIYARDFERFGYTEEMNISSCQQARSSAIKHSFGQSAKQILRGMGISGSRIRRVTRR